MVSFHSKYEGHSIIKETNWSGEINVYFYKTGLLLLFNIFLTNIYALVTKGYQLLYDGCKVLFILVFEPISHKFFWQPRYLGTSPNVMPPSVGQTNGNHMVLNWGWKGGWGSTSQPILSMVSRVCCGVWGRALFCWRITSLLWDPWLFSLMTGFTFFKNISKQYWLFTKDCSSW